MSAQTRWYHRHKDDPGFREKRAAYEARPEVRAARNERQRLRKAAAYVPGSANYDRDGTLRRKYGIGEAEYDGMYALQGGRCNVCREQFPSLEVDHDHATGLVRGLLCGPCNKALGLFRDDIERLRSAYDYILAHEVEAACHQRRAA